MLAGDVGGTPLVETDAAHNLQSAPLSLPGSRLQPRPMSDSESSDTTAIEEVAGEQLGVDRWDRPAIFRESADAATDNGLPYWMVLCLSGAIATLGLALDSSAVVIGAMLVAPLLAPVLGLALSLAVGDGRLAIQTGAVVVGSTFAVVTVGAVLTLLLPFQTITLEISARTRPTTLDLAIAIFSGLVGAVVTVARGSRLSAAIPGVAISVALIPPLAVAGFGIGIGWNGDLIRGSMLLYGANLAGIVLSGMAVFLAVGMHRRDVVEAARQWRDGVEPHGLAAYVDRSRWVRSIGVFSSARARIGLVAAFAIALGFPLSETLGQIAREARVERSIEQVARALFSVEGRVSILNREVVYGADRTRAFLRVATAQWLGEEVAREFEERASSLAGEPVRLTLEQIPAGGEDVEELAALLGGVAAPDRSAPPRASLAMPELANLTSERLRGLLTAVVLPDSAYLVRAEMLAGSGGGVLLRGTYLADEPLPPEAEQMLRRQIAISLGLAEADVRLVHVGTALRPLTGEPEDSTVLREVADLLEGNGLAVEILAPTQEDGGAGEEARRWLAEQGVAADRIRVRPDSSSGARLRIVPAGGAG
jgi:uncharacterized hydrophobic protein (TIGR00271 family)